MNYIIKALSPTGNHPLYFIETVSMNCKVIITMTKDKEQATLFPGEQQSDVYVKHLDSLGVMYFDKEEYKND